MNGMFINRDFHNRLRSVFGNSLEELLRHRRDALMTQIAQIENNAYPPYFEELSALDDDDHDLQGTIMRSLKEERDRVVRVENSLNEDSFHMVDHQDDLLGPPLPYVPPPRRSPLRPLNARVSPGPSVLPRRHSRSPVFMRDEEETEGQRVYREQQERMVLETTIKQSEDEAHHEKARREMFANGLRNADEVETDSERDEDEDLKRAIMESQVAEKERMRREELERRNKEEQERKRAEELERQERNRIREEQDRAYKESLEVDRLIELSKREEEEKAEQFVRQLEKQHELEEERKALELSKVLSSKPPPAPQKGDPDALDIIVQLPNGRIQRLFRKTDTFGDIHRFINFEMADDMSSLPEKYLLVTDYPRKVWDKLDEKIEGGMFQRRVLFRVESL